MRVSVHVLVGATALAVCAAIPIAQQAADTREAHCAAARAAAGTDFLALYNRFAEICGDPSDQPQRGRRRGDGGSGKCLHATRGTSRRRRCSTTSISLARKRTAPGRFRL